jgi:hypothetical protein
LGIFVLKKMLLCHRREKPFRRRSFMKPILYATALLIGLVVEANFTLFAEQTSSMSSSSTTQSTPENSHSNQDQAQMAAWMIETAQVSKDYVEGLDRGQYEESWAKGDQLFQHTISQQEQPEALRESSFSNTKRSASCNESSWTAKRGLYGRRI